MKSAIISKGKEKMGQSSFRPGQTSPTLLGDSSRISGMSPLGPPLKKGRMEYDATGVLQGSKRAEDAACLTPRAEAGHHTIVEPKQCWLAGEDHPIEAFENFKLDVISGLYANVPHKEIATRCLEGMGKVLSDFVRIIDEFDKDGDDVKSQLSSRVKSQLSSRVKSQLSSRVQALEGALAKSVEEISDIEGHILAIMHKVKGIFDQRANWKKERSIMHAMIDDLEARDAIRRAEKEQVQLLHKFEVQTLRKEHSSQQALIDNLTAQNMLHKFEVEMLRKEHSSQKAVINNLTAHNTIRRVEMEQVLLHHKFKVEQLRKELEELWTTEAECGDAFRMEYNTFLGRFAAAVVDTSGQTSAEYCGDFEYGRSKAGPSGGGSSV